MYLNIGSYVILHHIVLVDFHVEIKKGFRIFLHRENSERLGLRSFF